MCVYACCGCTWPCMMVIYVCISICYVYNTHTRAPTLCCVRNMHTHTHTHIHTYTHIHTHIHTHTYTHIRTHIRTHICTHIHVCVSVSVCLCEWESVCGRVWKTRFRNLSARSYTHLLHTLRNFTTNFTTHFTTHLTTHFTTHLHADVPCSRHLYAPAQLWGMHTCMYLTSSFYHPYHLLRPRAVKDFINFVLLKFCFTREGA